jgi:hypothetical protein
MHCTALHLLAIPVPHTTIGARSASHAVTRCLTPTHAWLVLQYSDLHSNYFCTTISFGTHANEPRQLLRHPLQILHRYGFPPTFVRAPPAKSGSGVPASTFLFPLVLACRYHFSFAACNSPISHYILYSVILVALCFDTLCAHKA